jgi:hypothetical protein
MAGGLFSNIELGFKLQMARSTMVNLFGGGN